MTTVSLICCIGLPGSGKTSWAKQYIADHSGWVRVNKDDIRLQLKHQGWKWSQLAENQTVVPERDRQIRTALGAGYSVISDDTNLAPKHLYALQDLADEYGATFDVRSFLNVPIGDCIRRDGLRLEPVGEAVIRKLAKIPTPWESSCE